MQDKRRLDGNDDEKQVVIEIRRVTKVTKGGKNLNFRALVTVGDGQGMVGYGVGKAKDVPESIRKATEKAKKSMLRIPLSGSTIPYDVKGKVGACRVILKPAQKGHGMVVGKTMRAFLETAGVKDITGKCLGSTNPINVIRATIKALYQVQTEQKVENETEPVKTTV